MPCKKMNSLTSLLLYFFVCKVFTFPRAISLSALCCQPGGTFKRSGAQFRKASLADRQRSCPRPRSSGHRHRRSSQTPIFSGLFTCHGGLPCQALFRKKAGERARRARPRCMLASGRPSARRVPTLHRLDRSDSVSGFRPRPKPNKSSLGRLARVTEARYTPRRRAS